MNRVVHFEIHASDPECCVAFYQSLFGWTIQKWEGPMEYWTIHTGTEDQPGIHGGMVRRHGSSPEAGQAVNAYVCTIQTQDLDGLLAKAIEHGAVIAVPKMPILGLGWLAYAKDPDGNLFGVMQPDSSAN